jgi:hypothetical protein
MIIEYHVLSFGRSPRTVPGVRPIARGVGYKEG